MQALKIVDLTGSDREIGFAHGQTLRAEIRKGAIPYFDHYLERILEHSSAPLLQMPLIRSQVLRHLDRKVRPKLQSRLPEFALEFARGLAEGADISFDSVMRTFTMPDTFLWLIGSWQKSLKLGFFGGPPPTPMCGCTSAIAGKTATVDGRILHARNFDYPAVGYWDAVPVVLRIKPNDGLQYLTVTSAGIPGGITGMNEAGITLVIHQHWVTQSDLDGVAVGVAGEMVLRKAHSLEQAIEILERFPPASGWTYVMTDGKTGEAVAYEVAPGGLRGRVTLGQTGIPDTLGYANRYLSKELEGSETGLHTHYWENCGARLTRSHELLKKDLGRHTPETLARLLGDCIDPKTGQPALVGNTIVSPVSVASVVFDPAAGGVWVASGRAPTPHGRFEWVTVKGEREQKSFTVPGFPMPGGDVSYQHFIEAARVSFSDGNYRVAYEEMVKATDVCDAAEWWMLRSLLALRVEEVVDAADAGHKAAEKYHAGGQKMRALEAELTQAQALDLLPGKRSFARALYRKVSRETPTRELRSVRRSARRGWLVPFTRWEARRIPMDFIFASRHWANPPQWIGEHV